MNINHNLAHSLQRQLLSSSTVLIATFILSIYFSTGLAVILSAVLGLVWLFSAQFLELPSLLKKYPVALWALILFACFIVGLSYGDTPIKNALSMVNKYRELTFIPILISLATTERNRHWAWLGFITASIITLLISYLMDFGVLPLNTNGDASLKSRITHSIFIAYFAFFFPHVFIYIFFTSK
jgi:hypothetical protein